MLRLTLVSTMLACHTAILHGAGKPTVEFYPETDLEARGKALAKKGQRFSSDPLANYGSTHYSMLASRTSTGSAEVHQHEADLFVIVSGSGALAFGGELVQPRLTKPGELRSNTLQHAERRSFQVGDVIHIPAGVPHQVLVQSGQPVSYFVLKIKGQ